MKISNTNLLVQAVSDIANPGATNKSQWYAWLELCQLKPAYRREAELQLLAGRRAVTFGQFTIRELAHPQAMYPETWVQLPSRRFGETTYFHTWINGIYKGDYYHD